jgi:hypothetical protein
MTTKEEEITFVATATITKKFSVPRDCYPENSTIEEIVEMEKRALEDDPGMILDGSESVVVVKRVE